MKLEANVKFNDNFLRARRFGVISTTVNVDEDYVEANDDSVYEWVANELEDKYGVSFDFNYDFTIENIDDIVDDLKVRASDDD